MENLRSTPLIERLYEIRANVHATLREASGLSDKLAGNQDSESGLTPDRVQDSVNSLVDDIQCGVQSLQKIVAEQHGILGAFAPPAPSQRARA